MKLDIMNLRMFRLSQRSASLLHLFHDIRGLASGCGSCPEQFPGGYFKAVETDGKEKAAPDKVQTYELALAVAAIE